MSKKENIISNDIVLVIWKDAASRHSGWTPLSEVDTSLPVVYSVGIVIEKDKEHIAIVQSIGDGDDDIFNLFVIPTGMIVKIETLKKGGK